MSTEGQRFAAACARDARENTTKATYGQLNASLPNGLYNDVEQSKSTRPHKREQPKHRLIICMSANGFTNREIAEKMEMNEVAIGHILRQPWARARIVAMQQEVGMDELQRTIKAGATQAVARIIQRAEDATIQTLHPELAQRADEYLANKYLGKPKEQVEHSRKPVDQMSDQELMQIIQSGTEVDAVVGEVELKNEGVGAA